jgi:hypothetical protein
MGEVAKTRKRKKRSAKPEKVLVYDSHTICSRSSSFMGGVAKTEKTKKKGVPNLKRYYLLLD